MYQFALHVPGTQGEQRSAPRRPLVLRLPARCGGWMLELVVHDISHTGFLAEAPAGVDIEDALLIELPELCAREARVVWKSGEFIGCNFAQPIARSVLSAALLRGDAQPATSPVITAPTVVTDTSTAPDDRLPLRTRLWILVACATVPWLAIGGTMLLA